MRSGSVGQIESFSLLSQNMAATAVSFQDI